VEFGTIALERNIAVHALDFGLGEITEAVFFDVFAGKVGRDTAAVAAGLDTDLLAAERTEHGVDLAAGVGEAVLHGDRQRTADGIQAEHRVAANDGDIADGIGRDDVQIDRIAERLVDAHAVLIDRKALCAAADGRGIKSSIRDVGAEAAAADVGDDDARHLLLDGLLNLPRTFGADLF